MTMRRRGERSPGASRSPRMHHADLLVVRLHHTARDVAALLANPGDPAAHDAAPGLALLSQLAHRGEVASCDHLRRRERARPWAPARVHERIHEAALDAHALAHGGALLVAIPSRRSHEALHGRLRRDPHVRYVSPVPIRSALAAPAGPAARHTIAGLFPPPRLWHLDRIGWPAARARRGFDDGRRVQVAVLDSGIDAGHPALERSIASYVYRDRDLVRSPSGRDFMGHGTHVAGIIAAAAPRQAGANHGGERALRVCGVSRARLHAFKIFSDHPQEEAALASFEYVVEPALLYRALADCIERKVDVVNMSMGGPAPPDPHEAHLFAALFAQGTSVVAAMGNLRQLGSPTQYPAAVPRVIAVGATDPDDIVASFSNAGPHIALCAPGVGIWSTLPRYEGPLGFAARGGSSRPGAAVLRNTHCDAWLGTSMAAPIVAGAVALLKANHPRVSVDDVRDRLMRTADRVPAMGRRKFTEDYGAGRLNLERLLAE